MPIAFVSRDRGGAFAPVATTPYRLGSDPRGDLVDLGPGVAAHHADLRRPKGEYILAAADGCVVRVNDREVPVMALRDGDTISLGARGRTWTFRHRMQDAFHPPGASLAAAWSGHPASADPASGPHRWGIGRGIEGRAPERCARVARAGDDPDLVVKRLGPLRAIEDGDRFLHLLQRIAGARCPGLARLLDGGLAVAGGAPQRWMATAWVDGTSVRERIATGGVPAALAIGLLRPVAAGLARLHARGIVHRDVAPGNVIGTDTGGVLIDYGQSFATDAGAPPSRGVVGTPGYVAPEEVLEGGAAVAPAADVYGLAAVGYALLTGQPPAHGEDVLAMLAQASAAPVRPSTYGIDVPGALETVLLEGLSQDPAARPTASAFLGALAFAETQLGLGGVAP